MGRAAPALLDVWIYFNLVSNTVLLPILVATFLFSRKAKRHPTLVNLCLTWIFSGIFSLLLCVPHRLSLYILTIAQILRRPDKGPGTTKSALHCADVALGRYHANVVRRCACALLQHDPRHE
jgi:hypothetical protein